ncbi:MAG: Methyltransferase [Fibrobacteres bacterium]|nr:Methyltransferase [Fibrobacterota bacterium]
MTTSALRKPGRTTVPQGPSNPAWRGRILESCLEGSFLPGKAALTSFLVNALYLFGDNSLFALGGAPAGVADELTRLGHRVAAGPEAGANRPGAGGRGSAGTGFSARKEGRYDRAVSLTQAFGRGGDAEIQDRLRTMRRAVRPGGLICFHVFDRDRAWSLAGERALSGEDPATRVRVGFDPSTGRISVRLARVAGRNGSEDPGCGGSLAVKAWNRAEIETLLRGAGLELERLYGDWEGAGPESPGSGRLIVVAARPRRARKKTRRNVQG